MILLKEFVPLLLIAFAVIATVQGVGAGLYWLVKRRLPTRSTAAVLGLVGVACSAVAIVLCTGRFIPPSGTQFRIVYTVQTEIDFRSHEVPYDVYCTKSAAQAEADSINQLDPTYSRSRVIVHPFRATVGIADGLIMSPEQFQYLTCRS